MTTPRRAHTRASTVVEPDGRNVRSGTWRLVAPALLAVMALVVAACTSSPDEATGPGGQDSEGADTATDSESTDGQAAPGLPTGSGTPRNAPADLEPTPLDAAIADLPAWSDAGTWGGGGVPGDGSEVTIPEGQRIRIDQDLNLSGLTIDGEAYFDPSVSVAITTDANIVVNGLLHMQPASPEVRHLIEFTGAGGNFVGGGMEPVDSDVGLWVTDRGQVVMEGSPRRGWTNVTGSVASGDTTVEVFDAAGWAVGDRVVLTPTNAPGLDEVGAEDVVASGFHETTIAALDGTTVTLADPVQHDHPLVADLYTAELANLTRNVELRGVEGGAGHLFIHSQEHPQRIRWTALDRMGIPDVLGRYPLHIHHAGMGSVGTLIEGVVSIDGQNHAFVPHESHGITMRDLVAFRSRGGEVVWWDEGDETNDLLLDRILVASSDASSFYLGRGTNMTLRDSVAVGVLNFFNDGGFEWENGSVGTWNVENVTAHNNLSPGVRVWQNADIPQVVDGYVAYHNYGPAIDHGAYSNRYTYRNGHYYGNLAGGVQLLATSDPLPISFENTIIDSGGVAEGAHFLLAHSAVPAPQPAVLRNVEFRGETGGPLIEFYTEGTTHQARCIDCTWPDGAELVAFNGNIDETNWLEIIDDSGAQRYSPDGSVVDIERPIRNSLGEGIGLTAEYFNNPDLTDLAFTTILKGSTEEWEWDPENPGFGVMPAHHSLSVEDGSSARLSGQIEIGEGDEGTQTFHTAFSGGLRLWIGDQLVIDDWDNFGLNGEIDDPGATGINETAVELTAGRHDIKIELRDPNEERGAWRGWFFDLLWSRPGGAPEVIAPSHLYPAIVPDNLPVPQTP